MALSASKEQGSGKVFKKLEAGSYPARLLGVIDLGLQNQRPFNGQVKPPVHQIMLTYELSDEFVEDENGNPQEEKPRQVSESFPLYSLTADRAKSTLRYNVLDPSNLHEGDFSQLIGTPISLTITLSPMKEGRQYENVAGISPMRAKDRDALSDIVNAPFFFDLDSPDMTVFNALYPWQQKIVVSNLEYAGSALEKLVGAHETADVTVVSEPNDSLAEMKY